jgi:hypothetical protein
MKLEDIPLDPDTSAAIPNEAPGTEERIVGVVTGVLIGFKENGAVPLVIFPRQRAEALAMAARTVVDLHAAHIGKPVVLMFEQGDPARPIIMGCIRGESTALAEAVGRVEVDTDGERLIVHAKEQLVLRCGKASITLTKAGKVLIQGAYVSSRSSGVNRIKGGSVQLN